MKNCVLFVAYISFFISFNAKAQTSDANPGVWQYFGTPASDPLINGRLLNFTWAEIEPSNNIWDWTGFDKGLSDGVKDGLPVIFMVYTKQDAPQWIYSAGVPKVTETDSRGKVIGYSPYFADPDYKSYFKRMIQKVHAHLETLSPSIRNLIIGVQGCYGSTGDYISYSGNVPAQYALDGQQFLALYQEFSQYYYNEYKNTNPTIYLMSNPRNQGSDAALWTEENCPGWQKAGTLGKGFQLNDEVTKYGWLFNLMNVPRSNGEYMRVRSELAGANTAAGWWKKAPYKNMFATMCYGVMWGLDWTNQTYNEIKDAANDSAFTFFNKYAGQKDPAKSTNAMCALKDVLDAADGVRFPASLYGNVSQGNTQRYVNIANKYASKGALLEDVRSATLSEMDNIRASGTNDVGWNLFSGNYERYLHQINASQTSVGYWNIQSAEPNAMYGKYGRGFDIANNMTALYFDVDNAFLSNKSLSAKYQVTIEVTYLDQGRGSWQLYYDAKGNKNKASVTVTCSNTSKWKKAVITLQDANFANRGKSASDFSIRSTGKKQDIIFSVIELSRPATALAAKAITMNENASTEVSQNIENKTAVLLVSPNPAHQTFFVQSAGGEPIEQLSIYNAAGRRVLQKNVAALRIAVNKSEVGGVSGIYFLQARTGKKLLYGKVIIQ